MNDFTSDSVSDTLSASAWGFDPLYWICERCDARYLTHPAAAGQAAASGLSCPRCASPLVALNGDSRPTPAAPELAQPFQLSPEGAAAQVERWGQAIPYAPADLNAAALRRRLQAVYLPAWLVDVDVQANWKAEAGFHYNVVSHQERFEQHGGWDSRQVQERRTRWEARLGRLLRSYANRPAPALEDHARLQALMGQLDLAGASAYQAQIVAPALVRLPDRSSDDAWSDVLPPLQAHAADECRRAAGADELRSFAWSAVFPKRNWTLMLASAYVTRYTDDEGRPQVVWINAHNGQVNGMRRASMLRARSAALKIAGAGLLLLLLAAVLLVGGVMLPPLLAFGVLALCLALAVGLGALYPLVQVWSFNRSPN